MTYTELFLDSNRGVYIPQCFAQAIDVKDWTGIKTEDLDVLRAGPDAEFYWDAWNSVLDSAETLDGKVLHQDGDLWLIARDKAVEDLNAYFSDVLEYETRHGDAGENYAGLVGDVDLQDVQRQLAEKTMVKAEDGDGDSLGYKWIKNLDLDLRGLDLEAVASLALDVFTMQAGSIFGPFGDGLVLGSFHVQEIETEIPEDFDGIVLDFVGDNGADAYISGRLAYIATDAVWYVVASVKDLQEAIDAEVMEDA